MMEAPKIEVTDISPSDDPALCRHEADTDLWPEVFHDGGDDSLQDQRTLTQQLHDQSLGPSSSPSPHSQASSPQRRPCSRRSERGGPGKSPSPSRASPRRRSPVPYSPVRQHHRPCSPGLLDNDCYDLALGSARGSPIPRLVDGSRALSLTSQEIMCVSFSDPFSSSSSSHSTFRDAENVHGVPVQHRSLQAEVGQMLEMGSQDLGDADLMADIHGETSWLDTACLPPDDSCLEDTLALLEEGGFPGAHGVGEDQVVQDEGDLFLYEADEEKPPSKNQRRLTHADSGHFLAAACPDPASFYDAEVTGQGFCEEMHSTTNGTEPFDWNSNCSQQEGQVAGAGNQERFLDTPDWDSEEEMEKEVMNFQTSGPGEAEACDMAEPSWGSGFNEIISASQSSSVCTLTSAALNAGAGAGAGASAGAADTASAAQQGHEGEVSNSHLCREKEELYQQYASGFHCSSPEAQCVMEGLTLDDPSWSSVEERKNVPASSYSFVSPKAVAELASLLDAEEEGESNDSTDMSILQHFSNDYDSSSGIFPYGVTPFSWYTASEDLGNLPSSVSAAGADSSDPHHHQASRTPEDFSLPRLVGSPPLHFPHCHNVALIHGSLSNPYNPHLPTPPIILTFPDSYKDDLDPTSALCRDPPPPPPAFQQSSAGQPAPVTFSSRQGPVGGFHQQGGDICKSTSCPNLAQSEDGYFQRPHYNTQPPWNHPHHHPHHHHPHQYNDTTSAYHSHGGAHGFRDGFHVIGSQPVLNSSSDYHHTQSSSACFGTPASAGNGSSRAAVIDRLRQVVQRRLSGSLGSLETRLHVE